MSFSGFEFYCCGRDMGKADLWRSFDISRRRIPISYAENLILVTAMNPCLADTGSTQNVNAVASFLTSNDMSVKF